MRTYNTDFGNHHFSTDFLYIYQIIQDQPERLESSLNDLLTKCREHYNSVLSEELFSQFCQNLFYYIAYKIKDRNQQQQLFEKIISIAVVNDFLFYRIPTYDRVVIWVDPREGNTALTAVCKIESKIVATFIIQKAKKAFWSNVRDFQAFLTHQNKGGFSPLNSACKEGYIDVVQKLIEVAKEIFRNDKKGFQAFLTHRNNYGFSPLCAACKEGHFEIVELLLETAKWTFQSDEKAFHDFLELQNNDGFTPLNAATFANQAQIAQLLLHCGANPDIPNKRRFSARTNAPKEWPEKFFPPFDRHNILPNRNRKRLPESRFYPSESDFNKRPRIGAGYSPYDCRLTMYPYSRRSADDPNSGYRSRHHHTHQNFKHYRSHGH